MSINTVLTIDPKGLCRQYYGALTAGPMEFLLFESTFGRAPCAVEATRIMNALSVARRQMSFQAVRSRVFLITSH